MTDRTPTPDRKRSSKSSPTEPSQERDSFGLWFSRVVRIVGLIIAIYQGILVSIVLQKSADPVALGAAATMMSGSLVADLVLKRGKAP